MKAGNLRLAEQEYRRAADLAVAARHWPLAADFLNNVMGLQLAQQRYAEAVRTWPIAEQAAAKAKKWDTVAAVNITAGSFFNRVGDVRNAGLALARAQQAAQQQRVPYSPLLLLEQARLAELRGETNRVEPLLQQALQQARQSKRPALAREALARAGYRYLALNKLAQAEQALRAAMAETNTAPRPELLRFLGVTLHRQGKLSEARSLLQRAALHPTGLGGLAWAAHFNYALLLNDLGQLDEALAELQQAARDIARWRPNVVRTETHLTNTEVRLSDVYNALVDALVRKAERSGDPQYLRQALLVSAANRSVSLRQAAAQRQLRERSLPLDYWQALDDYRRLATQAQPDTARLAALEEQLERWELGASAARVAPPARALSQVPALPPGTAGFYFHVAERRSFGWAWRDGQLAFASLPARAELARQVRQLRSQLESGPAGGTVAGQLYQRLFASFPAPLRAAPHWVVYPDAELWGLPFAALQQDGRYLVERHAVELAPALAALPAAAPAPPHTLLAFGDAVYNMADARFRGQRAAGPGLPRLPGSGVEVERSARIWTGTSRPATVWTGTQVTAEAVRNALHRHDVALHLAVHTDSDAQGRVRLALGLNPQGRQQYLGPAELRGRRDGPRLVVLSACRSGQGQVLPGVGLMGLGREWLQAGVPAVVAAHWPLPDDQGRIWEHFYRRLAQGAAPAEALRSAQAAMLQAGGTQGEPRRWAAFFVLGANQ